MSEQRDTREPKEPKEPKEVKEVKETKEAKEEKPSSQRGSLSKTGPQTGFPQPQTRQVMRYMPTYRLAPKNPINKEQCEKIIKEVLNRVFQNFTYHPKTSLNLAAQVSEEIKNRVKSFGFDRYRYIVVVSVGERLMQGFFSLVNFLWDAERDGYISYTYETPNFFVVGTLYYLYYD